MNWGLKIILAYLVFVAGILFLVFKANSSRFDLVEPKYYEAELAYQQRIDESNRMVALKEPVQIKPMDGQLKIIFPSSLIGKKIEGKALLYYPADAKQDREIDFSTTDSCMLSIEKSRKGWHHIKLSFAVNKQDYYYETGIHF